MLQDHPIDLVREQLARVVRGLGNGALGLLSALGLIGLLWLTSLKPADAAGPMLPPAPVITALAEAQGHLGVAPLRLDGSILAQTGALATGLTVCRLVLDPVAEGPQPGECAPPAQHAPGAGAAAP